MTLYTGLNVVQVDDDSAAAVCSVMPTGAGAQVTRIGANCPAGSRDRHRHRVRHCLDRGTQRRVISLRKANRREVKRYSENLE